MNDSYRDLFPAILTKKYCLDVRSEEQGCGETAPRTFSLRSIPTAGSLNSGGI